MNSCFPLFHTDWRNHKSLHPLLLSCALPSTSFLFSYRAFHLFLLLFLTRPPSFMASRGVHMIPLVSGPMPYCFPSLGPKGPGGQYSLYFLDSWVYPFPTGLYQGKNFESSPFFTLVDIVFILPTSSNVTSSVRPDLTSKKVMYSMVRSYKSLNIK